MTDSPHRPGSGWGEPDPSSYPGYTDPAYASQAPYGTSYQPPGVPAPTRQFPAYGQYDSGYDPYATGTYGPPYPPEGAPPEPPNGGPSRLWLWVLAAASVLIVLGLVIALVIINSSSQQVVVAPPPSLEPTFTTPSSPPTTTRRPTPTPTLPPLPFPIPGQTTTPGVPGQPTVPGQTETVSYDVDGTGRAISITYVDTGGVLQMEFNVMLPWHKDVELAEPADTSASVNVINFGRELTCSITVAGTVVEHRTGSGLTICGAPG